MSRDGLFGQLKIGEGLSRTWKELFNFVRKENPRRIKAFDRSTLFFLVVASVWFSVAYFFANDAPDTRSEVTPGWLVWHDQDGYLNETINLSHGELKPGQYWFGYPLLAVPFYNLLPRHAYYIPDMVLILVMLGAFYCCCRHHMGRLEAWVLISIFIFFDPILRENCLVVPWNTLPAYAAIYLSAYLLIFARPSAGGFVIAALMTGLALLGRPNEIVPLAAIYLLGALGWRDGLKWWAMGFFGFVLAMVGITIVSFNLYVYGHVSSPYVQQESAKFSYSNMGWKLYQLLCDGAFLTGDATLPRGSRTTQILERFPYFLLLVPGAIYLVRKHGLCAAGLLLAIAGSVIFYLTYNLVDSPAYFWSYGSFHYIWWIVPWLAFLAYLTFRQAIFALDWRLTAGALLAPVALYALIGFKGSEVAATDAPQDPIKITTDYRSETFTANLTVQTEVGKIQDLRVAFIKPPPYFGSSMDALPKVAIELNHIQKYTPGDYMLSQEKEGPFDISFLMHNLTVHKGDTITLHFTKTPELTVQRASLLAIRFAPGHAVTRLLTP